MSILSRGEIFAIAVAAPCLGMMFFVGDLVRSWNLGNFEDEVFGFMLGALFSIMGGAIIFGFKPRFYRFIRKSEDLPKPENQTPLKVDSVQENRPTRKHTENLRTEVYERLLRMTRDVGVSEPYMVDFVLYQGREAPIPVGKLRYLGRGIEHLRTGASYQRAYALWGYIRQLRCRYNDEVREIREELKIVLQGY